ncbi:porin [Rhodoblastus sp. 17X3]|uniref:porin n=1 Tax=Rhodoblastus sp. 17X3 TaxID=3047026 RepID=UPI0024B77A85|nr:porin [Rhodoblastus sp. 17X3]MDI9848872.1 porin [Rhodoblastus sp. 17X3]
MKLRKPLIAVAVIAAPFFTVHGAARADDITKLRQQAADLKKHNKSLEKRLDQLERQSAAKRAAQVPASDSFLASATKGPVEAIAGDGPITWHGITLFGTIDAGAGWQSHGLPANPNIYAAATLIGPNNNRAYFGPVPNGLQQSVIGLKGEEEILPGLAGVFYAGAGIVPTSGQLANAPGSLINQNGLSRYVYSNYADGSRGGQAFNDGLYAGLSSKTFGTLTFGRHRNFGGDTMIAYDPAGGSYAFSVIGISGAAAGGGDTENVRWDNSLKYKVSYGPVHFGAMYKFADGSGGSNVGNANTPTILYTPHNDAYQFILGGDYQGLSVDAIAGHYNQAISARILSAAQLAGTSTFISTENAVKTTTGNINANTLAGVVTDNTNLLIAAKYTWNQFKFFGGYEHVLMQNPHDSLGIGAQVQGGYALSSVNNHSVGSDKSVNYFWTGVKYAYNPNLDLTVSYYHVLQNAYVGPAPGSAKVVAACSNTSAANCSGTLDAASFYGDYHFNKHFDVYAGVFWSSVSNGLASGYLYHVEWAPSFGARYTF